APRITPDLPHHGRENRSTLLTPAPPEFRKVQYRRQLHESPRRPRLCRHRPQEREEAASHLPPGRPQRQPHAPGWHLRRVTRLVSSKCAADARPGGEELRPELHVGHRPARTEAGWSDFP